MIRSFKKIATASFLTLALLFGVSLLPGVVGVAEAQTNIEGVCSGAQAAGVEECQTGGEDALEGLVTVILNVLSWIIGVISVIMIIIGGFRYIISSGDTSQVESAKKTILYAVVGLVIVLFAQLIVRFVIGSISDNV